MRQLDRILCPVDLSDVSRHTVDHARLLADWYHAKLTALHVCNPIVVPATAFAVVGMAPEVMLTAHELDVVRSDVAALFKSSDVDVLIEHGDPAKQILDRAKSLPADMIVVGTHGTSGFEHFMLGSVTEKVLRHAACPVMTVPPHARATSRLPFRRLLCPVDFSDCSLAALDFAFSLAKEGDAEMTIVHVFEWPDEPLTTRPMAAPEFRQALEDDALVKLEGLVPSASRDWCRPVVRLAHGKAYREIVGIAAEDGTDLIIMGVQGRHALDLMLFGSTTNQVVRRATCPVMTLGH